MSNNSPASTPTPKSASNDISAAQSRKKTGKTFVSQTNPTTTNENGFFSVIANYIDETTHVQRTNEKCDKENASASATCDENTIYKPDIEIKTELNVILPESTKTSSMNSLLSPLNQVHHETKDNNTFNRSPSDGELTSLFGLEKETFPTDRLDLKIL